MSDSIEIKPIDFVCSENSRNIGESILGTAPVAYIWFLLEYDKAWGYDAIDESLIPDEVKKHLLTAMSALDPARTLIIKQNASAPSNRKSFYVVVANERPTMYKVPLGSYEALLDLDLVAMAKGEPPYGRFITDESIWLTCTNGMRDQCCARVGGAYLQCLQRCPWRLSLAMFACRRPSFRRQCRQLPQRLILWPHRTRRRSPSAKFR